MANGFIRRIKVEATILLPVTGANRYAEQTWTMDTNTKDLRVDFRLREFSAYPFPQGELKIYNLSLASRNLLSSAARVKISVGHRDDSLLPILFEGSVFWSEEKHVGVDVVAKFLLGGRLEFDQRVSASYDAPQQLYVVCKDLVDQAANQVNIRTGGVIESNLRLAIFRFAVGADSGLTELNIEEGAPGGVDDRDSGVSTEENFADLSRERSSEQASGVVYETPAPWSDSGKFSDVFTTLLSKFNLVWYCDESGTIHVSRGVLPIGTDVFTLNANNGMVGTPTLNRDGVTVKSLLDSRIKLRTLLRISSDRVETPGLYTPSEIEHKGSNWGNEWFTTIQAVR